MIALFILNFLATIASCHGTKSASIIHILPKNVDQNAAYASQGSDVYLRGRSAMKHTHVLREGFIDVSAVKCANFDMVDTMEVTLFDDEQPIIFNKVRSSRSDGVYYWYGEDDLQNSNLNIQLHGKHFTGYAVFILMILEVVAFLT